MKICIDPGHGGKDTGARGFGLSEKDLNLDISLKLEKLLRENRFEVFMTRRDDVTLSSNDRINLVNSFNCDIVLSIHNNSASSVEANGSEVIYPFESLEGKKLSQVILNNLGQIGLYERRIYYRLNSSGNDYYYMIREIQRLSVIVECAFISNPEDNELLRDDSFRSEIAKSISDSIISYRDGGETQEEHWARSDFEKIRNEGLVLEEHNLDSYVTWAEFSTVISRLIDRENN